MDYDVIVVGGGLAGLTAAAYLSKYGQSVLIIEKSTKVGGLASSFNRDGYIFDSGIRAFENSGIILPMIDSLGLKIKFVKNYVSVGIDQRWETFKSKSDIEKYATMLKDIFSNQTAEIDAIIKEIKTVMAQMDVIYGIDNPLFLDDFTDKEYIFKTLLPWLIKYQINIHKASKRKKPVNIHLRKFSDNQALIDMITQHFFTDTPAFFALSYFSLYLDYIYPLGGTGVLAEKTSEYITSHGGEIRLNSEVLSINNDEHNITLKDGDTLKYKKLIWSANQRTLYRSLVNKRSKNVAKMEQKCLNSQGGNSVLTLFIGANIDGQELLAKCGPHAFYTPTTEGLSSLPPWQKTSLINAYQWVKEYLNKTTYEISIPALRDKSLAPENKVGIIISTLFDYQLVKYFQEQNAYQDLKEFCQDEITRLMEIKIFAQLRDKIEFSFISTPLTIEKETGNFQGAITGWSFENSKMPAESRFKKIKNSIKTPIKDIYQCGAWTFSPSGLPVSILTGKLAADEVKKHLIKRRISKI